MPLIALLVFQSFDCAAGRFNGAQTKLSEIIGREIIYIPRKLIA